MFKLRYRIFIFLVDDEEIPNLYEKEDKRKFMSKDFKWGSCEEVLYYE